MRKLKARDIKDINLLKHYRIIRKWACKNNSLNDADLELLIYFDCMEYFTKNDFVEGTYSYSWDNRRWNRLLKEGWIVVWRKRNHTTQKYHIYKVSFKCKQLISRNRIQTKFLRELSVKLIKIKTDNYEYTHSCSIYF